MMVVMIFSRVSRACGSCFASNNGSVGGMLASAWSRVSALFEVSG